MAKPPDLNALLQRRILAAAVLLQAEHKRDLSKTYPPASRPGQYPAARTLNLRDSVTVVPIPGGWRIGYRGGTVDRRRAGIRGCP